MLADTWEWRTATPPARVPYGTGCAGSAGTPTLDAAPWAHPLLATGFAMEATSVRAAWPAFLSLGVSDTQAFGRPLPLDLAPLGMPGCALLASAEASLYAFANAAGSAAFSVNLPRDPALLGAAFFAQVLAPDLAANALGWVTSNALAVRIGQ